MRLLLDEDTQAHALVRLLREAGHDAETIAEAGMAGQADSAVLLYAKQTGRVLLTRNVRDFLVLHRADPQHAGILAEHQDADPAKNMSYRQIAAAIGKLEASGWTLPWGVCRPQCLAVNAALQGQY